MTIPAFYFDGKTSRKYAVTLSVDAGVAKLDGEIGRSAPLAALRVSERSAHAHRKVTFDDGAYLEILDNEAFRHLLRTTGFDESFVVGMQQSRRGIAMAIVLTLCLLLSGYLFVLPVLSKALAQRLPESVDRSIGSQTLAMLDRGMLGPSKLPEQRRNAIVERFKMLSPPQPGLPQYDILFRKSNIGPNALALPSGQIVLTDDIIELLDSDDALMGVLAHELGHLHERHLMRRVIQSTAVGAVAMLMVGDVSAVVANIPTALLDMKYSRDAEREADDYATAMLKANGIGVAGMIEAFEILAEKSDAAMPYLSSHPSFAERIKRIRQGN